MRMATDQEDIVEELRGKTRFRWECPITPQRDTNNRNEEYKPAHTEEPKISGSQGS